MLAQRLRSECGQDTVEWIGVLVVVAALIAVVLTLTGSSFASSIASGAACQIDAVFGGDGCGFVAGPMLDAQGNPTADSSGDPTSANGDATSTTGDPSSTTGAPTSTTGDGSAAAPWDSSNPVTRATWGTYVSLGDSYSAGEGLGDYQPGSHQVGVPQCVVYDYGGCELYGKPPLVNGCDRAASAYNATVSTGFQFAGGKQTWACSGSTVSDVYNPNDPNCTENSGGSGKYGEGCQINRVDPSTSLVTMGIGGNDIGFDQDLRQCYKLEIERQGCSSLVGPIDQKISDLGPQIVTMLQALRQRAPHARIILITYPQWFLPDPNQDRACLVGPAVCISPQDQKLMDQEIVKLDDQICASVAAAGVGGECVDARNAFSGCEMDTPNSCMQGPTLYFPAPGLPPEAYPGSFHPTARGEQKLGQLINQEIQNGPPPS